MWYVSRSFLYCMSLILTFSSTVVVKLASECPGKLKWYPVDLSVFCVLMYPMCSQILSCKFLSVSPMYLCLQFEILHSIIYIMFVCSLQVIWLLIYHVMFGPLTDFVSLIYGQIKHCLPHLFIPFNLLLGYGFCLGGSLALMRKSDMFFCLLNARSGGSGKTDFRYPSCDMDRQCFLCRACRSGSLGS